MRSHVVVHYATVAASAVAMIGLLTACGGGSQSGEATPVVSAAASVAAGEAAEAPSAAAPSASAVADDTAENETTGGVPDPCGLLSQDELASILGAAPGEGTVQGPSPEMRKVCTLPDGTILGVEVAVDYDATLAAVEKSGLDATLTDVSGVGDKATLITYDVGVLQLLAVEGDYFVDVTGMITEAQATALVKAMLAAI
ncbi:MAG: hypothetical protein IPO93_10710 [Actinobacteria bacterium]|nr:hypothetical protein [Actinomycetota bacterium]